MVIYLEKKMERSNSGDFKVISGTNLSTLNIGLMKCGRAKWQGAEATRKDFNIVLIHQDKIFFYLRALQGHSGRNPIDPTLQDSCVNSGQFLRAHSSCWMCNQFTLHHKFMIDSGRTKFKQGETYGLLYGCESHEKGSQRSA